MTRVREWKPGDVALIEVGCAANRHRGMYVPDDGWRYGDDQWVANDPAIVTVRRPLVVIDPENREHVQRLDDILYSDRHDHEDTVDGTQAALREFAEPKPKEPTGLGAVVVDSRNRYWIRFEAKTGWWWRDKTGDNCRWRDIDAVKVLSDGIPA